MVDKADLTRKFETYWRIVRGPELQPEYRFHETRRFRFDFCHEPSRTAIELQGGTWVSGRHSRPQGYSSDCEKINLAQLCGWRVFLLTTDMLDNDPQGHLKPIRDFMLEEADRRRELLLDIL